MGAVVAVPEAVHQLMVELQERSRIPTYLETRIMNASPCQHGGLRFSVIIALASLCLVAPCLLAAVAAEGDGDGGQRFTITIFADRDDAVVKKAVDGLNRIEANNPMMGQTAKGQEPYARITARPRASSKRIAAAVEILLDAGISKVIVEKKK